LAGVTGSPYNNVDRIAALNGVRIAPAIRPGKAIDDYLIVGPGLKVDSDCVALTAPPAMSPGFKRSGTTVGSLIRKNELVQVTRERHGRRSISKPRTIDRHVQIRAAAGEIHGIDSRVAGAAWNIAAPGGACARRRIRGPDLHGISRLG
jgi:hypothetical protein